MKKLNFKYVSLLLSIIFIFTSLTACKIELPNEVQDNTSSLFDNIESEASTNSDISREESSKTTISVDDLEDETNTDYEKYEDNTETSTYTISKWNHNDDNTNFDFSDDDGDGRDDETGLDEFLTDPIPDGKSHPVEPDDTTIIVDDLEDETNTDYEKYEDNTETSTYTTSKWNHNDDNTNFDFNDDDGDGRDDNTGLDEFLTDPIPNGKPQPVEPEDTTITGTAKTCTLSIRMDTILNNVDDLDEELKYMLKEEPTKSGAIYAKKQVIFYDGESVFDVLLRETKSNGIHMEFSFTPMYNSCYIEGINNFYEFSCGELSGWMYNVNGWYPNYGCSRYQVQQGDVIEWNYTCDLGRDLPGGEWLGGLS